ncbi:MAG: hypothetical protein ACUVX1_00635 [Chloroflexota bacterium]
MVYEAIDTDRVIDHLNMMVELELALDDVFEGAILATDDRLVREELARYRESTRYHRDLSVELLARYGSAPQPKDVLSSLVVDIEVGLTGGRKRQRELHRLQGLSVVVLLSRSNWEIVGLLVLAVGDQVMAERIEGVVRDKNEQLDWVRKQIVDLGQRTLVRRRLSRSI